MELKKRSVKTTTPQYMLYLEEMEGNKVFRTNSLAPNDHTTIQESWEKLVLKLNSCGGPQKSCAAWKRIFCDWKSVVKKRARQIKALQMQTGGGPPPKPLTDLEQKLLDTLGNIVINGLEGIPEIGLPGSISVNNTTCVVLQEEKGDRHQADTIKKTLASKPSLSSVQSTPCLSTVEMNDTSVLKTQRKTKNGIGGSIELAIENSNQVKNTLGLINENLKSLVAIESERLEISRQKLQLKTLEFQFKYPDVDVEFS